MTDLYCLDLTFREFLLLNFITQGIQIIAQRLVLIKTRICIRICNLSESYLFLEDLGLYRISGVGFVQLVARDNWISEFQLVCAVSTGSGVFCATWFSGFWTLFYLQSFGLICSLAKDNLFSYQKSSLPKDFLLKQVFFKIFKIERDCRYCCANLHFCVSLS